MCRSGGGAYWAGGLRLADGDGCRDVSEPRFVEASRCREAAEQAARWRTTWIANSDFGCTSFIVWK